MSLLINTEVRNEALKNRFLNWCPIECVERGNSLSQGGKQSLNEAQIIIVWATDAECRKWMFVMTIALHFADYVPGTNAYTPPEYIKTGRYDGCQGTVWQMGILLVEILSPVMAFDKPEHALKMGPRIPEQISSGNKLEYCIWLDMKGKWVI